MTRLTEIKGIDSGCISKLKAAGIASLEQLLQQGSTPEGRRRIAKQAGSTPKNVTGWINRADLCRIKGIGSEYADLLELSGVDSVPELAQRNPRHLLEKMREVNLKKKLHHKLPSEAQVMNWIQQARGLPKTVLH